MRCRKRGCHNNAYYEGLCWSHDQPRRDALAKADQAIGLKPLSWMPGDPHDPPANRSDEAVALREVAQQFGRLPDDPTDLYDRIGMEMNKRLLLAAIAYAKRVERAEKV